MYKLTMRVKGFITLFCRINDLSRNRYFTSHSSYIVTVSRSFSQWDIVGAVCLERKPVITQCLIPLEERYLNYIQKLEIEKSYLSDHEKRHIEEKRTEQKLKVGKLEDLDLAVKQTAQDFEDACTEELKKYRPAPRLTEADLKNDRHSTERKLDSSLVLLVNEKLGNEFKWVLPQAVHEEGETLRQTAERALRNVATYHRVVQFMGNAPVGYYKYKYPKAARGNGICGAKVFFFKAVLHDYKEDSVMVHKTDDVVDHLWLTHAELKEVLVPVLHKTVSSFLFPDVLVLDSVDDSEHIEEEEQATASASRFNSVQIA